jgi:hypothetical protein
LQVSCDHYSPLDFPTPPLRRQARTAGNKRSTSGVRNATLNSTFSVHVCRLQNAGRKERSLHIRESRCLLCPEAASACRNCRLEGFDIAVVFRHHPGNMDSIAVSGEPDFHYVRAHGQVVSKDQRYLASVLLSTKTCINI